MKRGYKRQPLTIFYLKQYWELGRENDDLNEFLNAVIRVASHG